MPGWRSWDRSGSLQHNTGVKQLCRLRQFSSVWRSGLGSGGVGTRRPTPPLPSPGQARTDTTAAATHHTILSVHIYPDNPRHSRNYLEFKIKFDDGSPAYKCNTEFKTGATKQKIPAGRPLDAD